MLIWIEMLIEAQKISESSATDLLKEIKEIVAIFSAAHKTARAHAKRF